MGPITIFDSTLRDGAQGTGVAFSLEDKLQAVRLLDQVGVQYVEAGNPGSNPKDAELFQRAASLPLKNAKLVSFGSTRRKNIPAWEDANLAAVLAAGTPVCCVFGKCWKFHVDRVLETTYEENFRMIEESCRFLKSHGREVIFDAEHFFDGWKDDPAFALEALRAALRGGADIVCLCDTNGGAFPGDVERVVQEVAAKIPVPIGVHFHEDCGMATANSVTAVLAGASQVQGTLRQRQPLHHHPQFAAEAGHPLHPPRGADAPDPPCAGTGLHRQHGPARLDALRGGERLCPQGRDARRRRAENAPLL